MGRETNHRASEWLPAELLRPEPDKPAPARDRRRPAKPHARRDSAHEPRVAAPRTARKPALKPKNPNREWVPAAELNGLNGNSAPRKTPLALPSRHVHQRPQASAPRRLEPSIDLNQARFDQLCSLGLAPHQAAGLIGRREQRGGFESVHELDELDGKYGLAREKIEVLKSSVVV
jgi:DNA uptake protein ComE-like DNA-binding protein